MKVAPHAGAWIEIEEERHKIEWAIGSHPTRVRGLKSPEKRQKERLRRVAPHAGAWIEIDRLERHLRRMPVAPHAGAWIEIIRTAPKISRIRSHPTRVRGLK